MKPIENWENVQEPTKFKRLAPGGYICAIKDVRNVEDKEYLEIQFDIVKGDEKGYFQKQYDNDTRKDKKWPNAGIIRRSYSGKSEKNKSFFKGFITSIEESNKNFAWNWDESKLKNKYFGAVIGEEEYLTQKGKKGVRNNVVFVYSTETIENGDFEIPQLKILSATKVSNQSTKPEFKSPFDDDTNDTDGVETGSPFDNDEASPFD